MYLMFYCGGALFYVVMNDKKEGNVLEKLTKCGWDLRVTFCILVERLFMTCSYR